LTNSTLSELQHEILEAFFRQESRFFLTGGAALAGFHLHHRSTEDLDLFTTSRNIREGMSVMYAVAEEIGATVERITSSPDFIRLLLNRSDEGVVVDLVYERALQGETEKIQKGVVRMDSPQEILANKLCTLLSRSEIRDVVDILALERAGFDMEVALDLAMKKDSGLTSAQLAWILSQLEIGDSASIPGGISVAELRDFIDDLQVRLRKLALPRQD